jgi:hypothetical protein
MASPPTPEPEPEPDATPDYQESPGQRAYRLLMEIAALTNDAPPDDRTDTSEHHDDVLYPKQGRVP